MKTEYTVFKATQGPYLSGDRTATVSLLVGAAQANGPKQAIKEVAQRLPEAERLGDYHACPTNSWHAHKVVAKPAELAVS